MPQAGVASARRRGGFSIARADAFTSMLTITDIRQRQSKELEDTKALGFSLDQPCNK
jgi:hypothetical protein